MGRSPCCDKSKVKRGPWSPEEDSILKNYLHTYGTGGNWIALPLKAGLKRCGKSCRLRWLNYLRPDIKHGGFTEEEDHIILSLYNKIGSRWSVIASHLQGRTDNDVKNYWNTKMKKKLMAAKTGMTISSNISIPNNSYGEFPYLMDMNYQDCEFPFSGETEIQENGTNTYCSSSFSTVTLPNSDQQVAASVLSSSPSFSQENNSCNYGSWPGNGGDEDDGFVFELGSGAGPATATATADGDFLDGFDFLEEMKTTTNEVGSVGLPNRICDSKPPQDHDQYCYYQSFANLLSKEL